jgi:hypothetical protein
VTDMKKKEAANDKLMYEIAQENKRLVEPLAKSLKEVEKLRLGLQNYEKVITSCCYYTDTKTGYRAWLSFVIQF